MRLVTNVAEGFTLAPKDDVGDAVQEGRPRFARDCRAFFYGEFRNHRKKMIELSLATIVSHLIPPTAAVVRGRTGGSPTIFRVRDYGRSDRAHCAGPRRFPAFSNPEIHYAPSVPTSTSAESCVRLNFNTHVCLERTLLIERPNCITSVPCAQGVRERFVTSPSGAIRRRPRAAHAPHDRPYRRERSSA